MKNRVHLVVLATFFSIAFFYLKAQNLPENSNGNPLMIIQGDIVTMDPHKGMIEDGLVVVDLTTGKIIDITNGANPYPPAQIEKRVKTDGFIYPGLIDLHNHVEYNTNQFVEFGKKFKSRYGWQEFQKYKEWFHHYNKSISSQYRDSVSIYAEMKALVGGVTLIQGIDEHLHNPKLYDSFLMNFKNAEFQNKVYPAIFVYNKWLNSLNESGTDFPFVNDIQQTIRYKHRDWKKPWVKMDNLIHDPSNIRAFVMHLSEGYDERNKHEFEKFAYNQLLDSTSVILHGIALEDDDWKEVANYGASMVWTPTSNLFLYGKTAKVKSIKRYNINMCLGTDWSPSSPKSVLHELKVAYEYNKKELNNLLTDKEFIEMVTINPAKAIHFEDKVGVLQKGAIANIVIFDKVVTDPYTSLINATEDNLQLSIIKGQALYGSPDLMALFHHTDDLEVIPNFKKDKSLFWDIPGYANLSMNAISTFLDKKMNDCENESVKLDPLAPDDRYWGQIKKNTGIDIKHYWEPNNVSASKKK